MCCIIGFEYAFDRKSLKDWKVFYYWIEYPFDNSLLKDMWPQLKLFYDISLRKA